MKSKVYGIVSIYDRTELLRHFLDHYKHLGVFRMLLSVRTESAMKDVAEHVKDYGYAKAIYTPSECFADSDKAAVEERLLVSENIASDDYVLHLDFDELQQYPAPLSMVVAEMNTRNIAAVRGWIVDRVARDGKLVPVKPAPSIWEQFPYATDLTARVLKGDTQKIMICRRHVKLKDNVRHTTVNARIDQVPVPGNYLVHHFKWTEGLDRRLETRLRKDITGPFYRKECMRFLQHFHAHNGIDLCSRQVNARQSPNPLSRFSRFILLSSNRSGSNLLVNALNSCSPGEVLTCYSECFHPNFKGDFMQSELFRCLRMPVPYYRQTKLSPSEYLQQVIWPENQPSRCVGLKLQLEHPTTPEALKAAQAIGCRVIYLWRADKVAQAVSREIALIRKRWWSTGSEGAVDRITLNVKRGREWARKNKKQIGWARRVLPADALRVSYESLFAYGGLARILEWLGVQHSLDGLDSIPLPTPDTSIANYDEFAVAIARVYGL